MALANSFGMSSRDVPSGHIGHGTDTDEKPAWAGGTEPTGQPREQDSAGAGRGFGLGVSTIIGILLMAVPLIWAFVYLSQAGTTGLGSGFTFLVGVVLLAAIGVGFVLARGLFRT
jgi:hypothetical protein